MTENMTIEQEDAVFADATERGQAIYERLKPTLEPEFDGKAVAIHVDSGDYEIANGLPEARRILHNRRPEGMLYSRTVGIERNSPMIARILAGVKS